MKLLAGAFLVVLVETGVAADDETVPRPVLAGRLVLVGDAGLSIGEIATELDPVAPIEACRQPAPEPVAADAALVAAAVQVPILASLRETLARPKPNAVVWLGDNVYQRGIAEGLTVDRFWTPEGPLKEGAEAHVEYPSFAALHVQVSASSLADLAIFVPGNHDWDSRIKASPTGATRVAAQAIAIKELACRIKGADPDKIRLLPESASPGPAVVDLPFGPRSVRLLLIDTEALLQLMKRSEDDDPCGSADGFFGRLKGRIDEAAGDVIVAAHHPLTTHGPHGGYYGSGTRAFFEGIVRRIAKSNQDLNGKVNARMVGCIRGVLSGVRGRVLAYASGHEHSLQIIRHRTNEYWELGTGAASKTTPVRYGEGSQYARSVNGFMYVDFFADGSSVLNVVTVEAEDNPVTMQLPLSGRGMPAAAVSQEPE